MKKKLTKSEIQLELESLIELAEDRSISMAEKTMEDKLIWLRTLIVYLKFDNEALRRELRVARNKK